jgi:hypothetical protein
MNIIRFTATQLDAFPETKGVSDNETDELFTLFPTLQLLSRKAGVHGWDLDVAACLLAHVCARYFTKKDNGLLLPWWGRVWCNPPWSDIGPWVDKAWAEWERSRVVKVIGMLLPADRTDRDWWHEFVEPYRDQPSSELHTYNLPDRTAYGQPTDLMAENYKSTMRAGSVFLWWKRDSKTAKRRKNRC